MEIGIGLPNAIRSVQGPALIDFAREAEQAGFSSLGTIDRIVYDNYESLIALAAAAAVTERIRLLTSILIAPLRSNTALLAKQAASVDGLSGGRLVLGIAPGGREDDYEVSGIDFHTRGGFFDRQLDELRRLWDGDQVGPKPARPGGPMVVLGGQSDAAFRRTAEHGAGWMMGGGTPDMFREAMPKLDAAWKEAGREGEPRRMALGYFSLGPDAERSANENLGHYYAWLGDYAQQIAGSAAKDADTVKQYAAAFEEAGADEFVFFPASPDPGQVTLLREALG
ncbi:MAG: LLM class flavin-dependent oxidoreductase [Actinobacteria bacterium]|nr:MAG: LLM class flavin-dependent oxidoreductase [Actinomycetota bacterium]